MSYELFGLFVTEIVITVLNYSHYSVKLQSFRSEKSDCSRDLLGELLMAALKLQLLSSNFLFLALKLMILLLSTPKHPLEKLG